jgi:hypothetical protein
MNDVDARLRHSLFDGFHLPTPDSSVADRLGYRLVPTESGGDGLN